MILSTKRDSSQVKTNNILGSTKILLISKSITKLLKIILKGMELGKLQRTVSAPKPRVLLFKKDLIKINYTSAFVYKFLIKHLQVML